jgi:hypothetical protein
MVTMPRMWLAAGLGVSALFGGGVALFSGDPLHRLWGTSAGIAYALATITVLAWRPRDRRVADVVLAILLGGAILIPLLWMVATGHGEPEVGVVANSAQTLIKQGTPYKSSQVLAATTNPNLYNPYLPLMAAFGVPQALFGHGLLTDPRVWFGVVFLIVFAFALRIAGARDCVRWALLTDGVSRSSRSSCASAAPTCPWSRSCAWASPCSGGSGAPTRSPPGWPSASPRR